MAPSAWFVEAEPKPVERQGGTEDQDTIGNRHAPKGQYLNVQQQHQGPIQTDGRAT